MPDSRSAQPLRRRPGRHRVSLHRVSLHRVSLHRVSLHRVSLHRAAAGLLAVAVTAAAALFGTAAATAAPDTTPGTNAAAAAAAPQTVTFDGYSFVIGGRRTYLFSGEFHYFRLPSPDLWRDVLVKMKAAGFNATSIYFDWAYHSPKRGVYDFTGVRDVDKLLDIATEVGIYVIARPGPYINAEVDSGGFPGWLTTQAGRARTNTADYLAASDEWLTRIDAIIARHQITNGTGTVISYQVENEFYDTSAAADAYVEHLKARARADGVTVPLVGNHNNNFISGTGALDLDSPDSYPQGFNCSNPTSWRPVQSYSRYRYAGHPLAIAEFQGGAFDPWGGPGYDRCRQLTGPEFQKVFYKDAIGQGITEQNFYMAYGGTSWGWQPDPQQVYSSYDYGAAITEARQLGAKYDEDKRIGYLTQSVASLAKTDPSAAAPLTSTAIQDTARVNPDDGTQFHVLRHVDSTSTATDTTTMALNLGAAGSYPRVPFQSAITLAGRDSKIIVANYRLGAQQLQYSTSEILTHDSIDGRDVAVLYGRDGQAGETMLDYPTRPTVTVLSGSVSSTYNTSTGDLRLNYTHSGLARVLITGGTRALLLVLGTDDSAATFWRQQTSTGPVLVRGPHLLRTATTSGSALALTGDVAAAGELEVFAAADSVTFNGAAVATSVTPSGSRQGTLAGPRAVTLPALSWKFAAESPEAQPAFDDSTWTVANRTTSNSTTTPLTRPVLFTDEYGFHYGDVWYRGHFTGNATQTGVDLSAITGRAGVWSVWLGGRFLGSVAPSGSGRQSQRTFTFPSGAVRQGADNVLSVLVQNQGHNEDYNRDDTHKEARGLIGATLTGSTANPLTWRIQGARGGENLADTVRGPMNNGGLYGERNGWHLPGFDTSSWAATSLPRTSTTPGITWYRAEAALDLPAGQDTSVGIRIDDPATRQYRAEIFVNGWNIGRYVNNVGPQHSFPIPTGILRPDGANSIAIAVWNTDASTGGLGTVRLESYGSPLSSLQVAAVASPGAATPGGSTEVSALTPVSQTNGWGPVEVNSSNGEAAAGDGQPITVGGTVYASGLGVHAASEVALDLGGRCSRFTAIAGVDDEVAGSGSVTFAVLADGASRFASPVVTGSSAPLAVDVDVTGVRELRLVVGDGGNGTGKDHADWADARLSCS